MSSAPGWYTQPDGRQRYWDGAQWTQYYSPGVAAPTPATGPSAEAPHVRHRRNHAVAGVGFIVAGFLIGFGVTQALETFSGPPFEVSLLKQVSLSVTPSHGYGLDPSSLGLWLAAAGALMVFGLLLLVTRVRYLGLVWRLGGLIAIALPALLAFSQWTFINDPTAALKDGTDSNVFAQGIAMVADNTRGTLWDLAAGTGLYLLTAGVVCGVISALIPAMRRQEVSYGR